MEWTKQKLNKYFGHMEDHQYAHYNNALGKKIHSKEHFLSELNLGDKIPYDVACQAADDWDSKKSKEYKVSEKALEIIQALKSSADRKGNLTLGGRTIKALKEIGAIPSEDVQAAYLERIKEYGQ